jgi:hypothetical protein
MVHFQPPPCLGPNDTEASTRNRQLIWSPSADRGRRIFGRVWKVRKYNAGTVEFICFD